MVMVTGGFVLAVACIILGLGYWWGYKKGKAVGNSAGHSTGFFHHEDMVINRIKKCYPDQADEMILRLLS